MTTYDARTLADLEEIRRVLSLYCKCLDQRRFADLDAVFTDDTVGVYREAGTYHGREAVSRFIEAALTQCGPTQHLIGSIDLAVDGDRATGSCYLQAIHLAKKPGYEGRVWTFWGEYLDEFRRTPQGWRISRRELATIHMDGDIGLHM